MQDEVETEEKGCVKGVEFSEDPRLDEFYPKGNKLHERLFFRIGDEARDILPFDERVSTPPVASI